MNTKNIPMTIQCEDVPSVLLHMSYLFPQHPYFWQLTAFILAGGFFFNGCIVYYLARDFAKEYPPNNMTTENNRLIKDLSRKLSKMENKLNQINGAVSNGRRDQKKAMSGGK